ncbi:MAG: hypothetical protein DRP92_08015 [Candidatus Neomarinimicrobiota bacterium]|nr:MAG: hypothetical protein DRP92_08015 [Candidatus Neomarinimicrobiota bacterium]
MYAKITLLFLMLIFLLLIAYGEEEYRVYTIETYFDITELSINQFIRTYIFPNPVGTYSEGGNVYSYNIVLTQPEIVLSDGQVRFRSVIYGSVSVLDKEYKYRYPINVRVGIPDGSISISGIVGFLEGIPEAINSIEVGPQWLKDRVIEAYDNLELSLYPVELLEEINRAFPDELDISIEDIGFGWQVLEGKIRVIVSVNSKSRGPIIKVVNRGEMDSETLFITIKSNVRLKAVLKGLYYFDTATQRASGPINIDIPPPEDGEEYGDEVTIKFYNPEGYPSGSYRFMLLFVNRYYWFYFYYLYCLVK